MRGIGGRKKRALPAIAATAAAVSTTAVAATAVATATSAVTAATMTTAAATTLSFLGLVDLDGTTVKICTVEALNRFFCIGVVCKCNKPKAS